MFRHPSGPLLSLALALTLASACVRSPSGGNGRVESPSEWLTLSNQIESLLSTVEGQASLSIHSPQGNGSVTLLISAQHPGKVHVEQLDFFGSVQAVLVSNGAAFGLLQGGRYYQGAPNQENLARFIPLPLDPSELTSVLLGRTPRISEPVVTRGIGAQGNEQIILKNGAQIQTLWIDPASHRVRKSVMNGPHPYTLEFGEFQGREQAYFPARAVLVDPATGSRFELHYHDDVVLNPSLDPATFSPEAPQGVPVVNLNS